MHHFHVQAIGGRLKWLKPIRVRASQNQDARGCQIIYLALTKVSDLKRELTAFNESTRAITIGEDDKFLELGGAVNLHMTDGHVGFEVNVSTIESRGVTISSKLLRFGQVRRGVETP